MKKRNTQTDYQKKNSSVNHAYQVRIYVIINQLFDHIEFRRYEMNKQELICELNSQKDKPTVNYFTLEKREGYQEGMRIAKFIAEKLDEPQKVKLPPCVAAWIKWNKGRAGSVFILFDIDKASAFEKHQNGK